MGEIWRVEMHGAHAQGGKQANYQLPELDQIFSEEAGWTVDRPEPHGTLHNGR